MGVQDLMTTESTTQDVIETERAGLAKYTEDKNNEILGLNNELARLQTKLEEVKASAMKWYVYYITIQCTTTNYLTPELVTNISPHDLHSIMSVTSFFLHCTECIGTCRLYTRLLLLHLHLIRTILLVA